MKSLDEIPYNDAIKLYYEKHHAIRQSDLMKLLELKNRYPELFDDKKDKQIHDIIEYAKKFMNSTFYKNLRRLEIKQKLTVIPNPSYNK